MRRFGWGYLSILGFLFLSIPTFAQNTLDALEQELNQTKQDHQEASSQNFSTLIDQLDKAVQGPDEALALYQQAGGDMPDAAAVITRYSDETPDEKSQRLAQDQANRTSLAYVAQLHCGLMRFAALFIQPPDKQDMHDEWVAWLKTAAQIYPQTAKNSDDTRQKPAPPDNAKDNPKDKTGRGGGGGGGGRPRKKDDSANKAMDLKGKAVRDSIISTYLGFHGWNDKEQSQWKVSDLPRLYRSDVLEPLRVARKPDLLAAWDVYITMRQIDQTDRDAWALVDYPSLAFDRATDDYVLTPSTEKLSVLVDIIKANPNYPKVDELLNRAHQLMDGYRKMKAGGPPPTMTPMSGPPAKT